MSNPAMHLAPSTNGSGSGAKPTRDPGIRARIRGRGVDWGDPALFCRLSPMPFLMIGYTMNGCQNLNSRRALRGDYEKVVNQYPPFCASSSVNLGGLCVCGSSFSSFFVEIFATSMAYLAWREGCRGTHSSNTSSHPSYTRRLYRPMPTGIAGTFEPI